MEAKETESCEPGPYVWVSLKGSDALCEKDADCEKASFWKSRLSGPIDGRRERTLAISTKQFCS
jgi:hypothetical protein